MKKTNLILLSLSLFCTSLLQAKGADPLFGQETQKHIEVNNTILAKVNGKAISVIDAMKKLDMIFYKQFPEYAHSTEARFKFYQMHWKDALAQLIDKELVLADAAEHKIEISSGDIRQEMETTFGPNVIENLDDAGLTYDEAFKMVSDELLIRRTVAVRVTPKSFRKMTPQALRDYYEEYAKNNIRSHQWSYQVISIRDKQPTRGQKTVNQVYELLVTQKVPLAELVEKWKAEHKDVPSVVNVSEEYKHNDVEISDLFKKTLTNMQNGQYSTPVAQLSRRDGSTVYRIFYLKEMIPGGTIPFNEVEQALKDKLFDKVMDEETANYFTNLHKHFDIQESDIAGMIPKNFEPFVLK